MNAAERIAAAIETISDGFALLDRDYRFVVINGKFRQIYGLSEEALRVGDRYADFVRRIALSEGQEDVDAYVARRLVRLAESGEPYERQLADGRWIRIADYRADDGGFICIRTDITGRVRREQALKESEERFRRLSEITFEAVLILNEGRIVDFNRALVDLSGFQPDELIGMSTLDLLAPEYRDFARQRIVEQDERPYAAVGLRKSGERVAVELHFRHVDHAGQRLRVVAVRDVSSQRRTERALAEHQAQNRAIVETALDAIVTVDAAGSIVEFNPAAERIFGYAREAAVGRQVAETIVPPEHRSSHRDGFARYLETGERNLIGRRIEIEAMRADGSLLPVELAMTELNLEDGRLFTAFIRDLTEAKRLEQEVAQQRERMHQSEKLGALGSLLAGVAHELNNPLSVVVAQAALLEELTADDGARGRAQRIRAAAERCAKIIRTFLAMARQRPAERRAVDVERLVADALELVGYGLNAAGIRLEREIEQALPPVWGDGDQLNQVLANLLINAQQALQQAPEPRRLRLSARHDAAGEAVVIAVSDSGPGVPAEIRGRIFEPFYTTKPVGLGTGVGLSVCHGIVTTHGGSIAVDEALEGGARFTVRLPVGLPAAVDETPAAVPAALGRRRVLVVDDEPDIVETIAEILGAQGHRVDTAASGATALRLIAEADYDVIFSDLRMPDMDGATLYRRLRQDRPELARRLVIVTGDMLNVDARTFLETSGVQCLEKPFTTDQVRRIAADAMAPG